MNRKRNMSTKENGNWKRLFSEILVVVMLLTAILSAGIFSFPDKVYAASASANTLVVKNANEESGMWNLPMMNYLYSSVENKKVRNYVKYIDNDSANGWRLAYCTQFSRHFVDSAEYIGKTWQSNGMYSEISYAIAHGSNLYGDKNDAAYSTGSWLKDYYVTQAVIYCILADYGYDGHPLESLSAVDGYRDVYDCTLAMYKDVKANAGKDGYGDNPMYKIVAPASTKMTLTADGNYYRSGWYSIQSSGTVTSKSINLSGAPKGCEIVYENKNSLTSRFYVQIPAKQAMEMSGDQAAFRITASAGFERPLAYLYETKIADYQNITFEQKQVEPNVRVSESEVSLSLEKCKIAVHKTDETTENGVEGAIYGIYSDASCTKLVVTMPATDKDGYAEAEFVKRQDTYYVKEITASKGYLVNPSVERVSVHVKQTSEVSVKESQVKGQIDIKKTDQEKEAFVSQGDASLVGAEYGLYAKQDIEHPDGHTGILYKAGTLVQKQKIGEAGEASFKNLYLGEYYIKEISAPSGYILDKTEYPVTLSYQDQKISLVVENLTVSDRVKKQAFEIIKVSTDGESAETMLVGDAEFTVKLERDVKEKGWDAAKVYDVLTTDSKGYAKSIELPYGTYHVKETKTPENVNTTKDFYVTISEDSRIPQSWRAFNDAPFSAYIRLIKQDIDTGETILLKGTTFKIRDTATGKDISMKVGNKWVSEFVTDETGMVTTPLKLLPGEYEVYEITAPAGYVLCTEAMTFSVSGNGEYQADEDGDFIIDLKMKNRQQYGTVTLYKHGETLSAKAEQAAQENVSQENVSQEAAGDEKTENRFVYEDRPVCGSEFWLVCDEDIYTADHQVNGDGSRKLAVYQGITLKKGAVAATLITDEEGKAMADRLPLGKYHIEEVKASEGFVLNTKSDAFSLTYAGQHTELTYHDSDFVNDRQKVALSLIKTSTEEEKAVEGAEYGLFAKEDLKAYDGTVVVKADELIESQITDAEGMLAFESDLPLGYYYVKELSEAPGYYLDEEIYDVDASYQGQEINVIEKTLEVQDVPTITEFSKVDLTTGEEVSGAQLQILNEEGTIVEEWVSAGEKHTVYGLLEGNYTFREIMAPKGYVVSSDVEFSIKKDGRVQQVIMKDDTVKGRVVIDKTDSHTGKPLKNVEFELQDVKGNVLETLITDDHGHAESRLYEIASWKDGVYSEPLHYVLIETKAAEGYLPDETEYDIAFEYVDDQTPIVEVHKEIVNEKMIEKAETPKTGDDMRIFVPAVVLGAALAGAGICGVIRRKRKWMFWK